jgi:chromosome segregation ATPase
MQHWGNTDMDIEKTMEFILEQQGEFATHIGALREQQAELAARQATSERQIEALSQTVQGLVEVARLHSERLDAHDRRLEAHDRQLEAQDRRLEAQDRRLEAQEKRLEAQEKRSEAFERRFDQFLERFDAYLRGRGGNGR